MLPRIIMKDKIKKMLRKKLRQVAILRPKVCLIEDQIEILCVILDRWDCDLSSVEKLNALTLLKEHFGIEDEKYS